MDSIQVIHTGSPKIYIEDVERRPNLVFLLHVRSADRKLIKFWFLFLLGFITRQTAVLGSGTGMRIVITTCARKKKPELFEIACRDVSF